jgi:hypothetical protein
LPFTLTADADDDHDGVPNLVEYAFGTDPADPTSQRSMSVTAQPAAPGFSAALTISIPVGLLADGYQTTLQGSTDLSRWSEITPPPDALGITLSHGGSASSLLSIPATAIPSVPPQFYRVLITKPHL